MRNKPDITVLDFNLSKKDLKTFSETFGRALHNNEFIILKNHGIDEALFEANRKAMHQFCQLNDSPKHIFSESRQGKTSVVFDQGHSFNSQNTHIQNLENSALKMHLELGAITDILLSALAIHMKQPADFFKCDPNLRPHRLRLIEYNGKQATNKHTDFSLLTLLSSPDQGLYFYPQKGRKICVTLKDGQLLINAGRALALLTNNYFRPCPHRVEIGNGHKRNSIVYFANMHPSDTLNILKTFEHYNGGLKDQKWFQSIESLPIQYETFIQQRLKNEFSKSAAPHPDYKPANRRFRHQPPQR